MAWCESGSQGQACEDCHGPLHGAGRFPVEDEWRFQDRWLLEVEAEREACPPSSQGRPSTYEEAVHVQGKAGYQNSPRGSHEEIQ